MRCPANDPSIPLRTARVAVAMALAAASVPAQEAEDPAAAAAAEAAQADYARFDEWLRRYEEGTFRLVRHDREDPEALAQIEDLFADLAGHDTLEAAERLLAAASVQPDLPGAKSSLDRVTFVRELRPWTVRERARDCLANMNLDGLDEWLVGRVQRSFGDPNATADPVRAAAIRVLGARGGAPGTESLLQATRRLPPQARAQAIQALARVATLAAVPHFVDLLRDSDPGVRIAALNALGSGLAPHVDERRHEDLSAEVGSLRDRALDRMGELLERDRVWQVRAAAAENLARLGTKLAVPLLIDGLAAELRRRKDPWAMDLRLHRLLEGMTGQSMIAGSVRPWQQWWRDHGAAFRFTDSTEKARASREEARKGGRVYQEFFNLRLESDRVLFVLDFSGSMAEEVTLKSSTTASPAGRTTTKARIVVDELKRIVMSLPDGTLFNLIVFSDDVRIWRSHPDGRPMLVSIDDEARDDLLGSFLDGLNPAGPTNLHGALSMALDLGGRGMWDERYGLGFDTLYVMSDGAPTYGEIIDTDEILRRVGEANALRRLVIHAVTFGDKNEMRFLKRLAEHNGGRHIHVE